MWEQTVKKDENEIEKLKKVRKESMKRQTKNWKRYDRQKGNIHNLQSPLLRKTLKPKWGKK